MTEFDVFICAVGMVVNLGIVLFGVLNRVNKLSGDSVRPLAAYRRQNGMVIKEKTTGILYTVYGVNKIDNVYNMTEFLIYRNGSWEWVNVNNFKGLEED
jgi:hypothetical protein